MFQNSPQEFSSETHASMGHAVTENRSKNATTPPSVNFHLTKYCNMKCKICYATFHDLGHVKHDFEKSCEIIHALAEAGFEKLTFAGGEPTLVKELPELAKWAKELGLVTTIVTNGSKLSDQSFFDQLTPHLDWVAISIDSVEEAKNIQSGRAVLGKEALTASYYCELHQKLRDQGIKTKINTVVSAYNHEESFTQFINGCQPNRWKVLQALPIDGQNSQYQAEFKVSDAHFKAFQERHANINSATKVVFEEISLIKGSYIMVSPEGKFYDNTSNGYRYSERLLDVGVEEALAQIDFDMAKFLNRGGKYQW